jgi:hypothetical protein
VQEGPQTGYEYRLGPTSDYLEAHVAVVGSLNRVRYACSADGEHREWPWYRVELSSSLYSAVGES